MRRPRRIQIEDLPLAAVFLDATGKIPLAYLQEVLAIRDLSDVSAVTGSGSTPVFDTNPIIYGPTIDKIYAIGGDEILELAPAFTGGNWLKIINAASSADVKLTAGGASTPKGIDLLSQGSTIKVDSSPIVTLAIVSATPTPSFIPLADGSGKLAAGWIQEVLALADLSDVSSKTGTGAVVVMATNPVFPSYFDQTSIANPSQPSAGTARLFSRSYGTSLDWLVAMDAGTGYGLQLGQDVTYAVKKSSLGATGALKAVYLLGTVTTGFANIGLAKANASTTMPCLGITRDSIGGSGGIGRVFVSGRIQGVDTSSWSVGDILYVSAATAGALTNTAPAAPNIVQPIGQVLVSDATVGELLVFCQRDVDGLATQFIANTISLGDGTAGNKIIAFRAGSTGNLRWNPSTAKVLDLPDATDTLVGKATTDTLTNKTFDTAGAGNVLSINGVAATDNTGTGKVVRDTSPTIVTPTVASLVNMTHVHTAAASGGNLFGADGVTTANLAVQCADNRMGKGIETNERFGRSILPSSASAFTMISATAYAVYLGRVEVAFTPKHVYFWCAALGSGAQTAEVGFFSSPTAPSRAGQTLTKLVATGTVDGLVTIGATGVKGNTSAFGTSVAAGTYLWAVIRVANATTQPTIYGLTMDMSQGCVLAVASAGALTGMTTQAFALITAAVTAQCPDLMWALD